MLDNSVFAFALLPVAIVVGSLAHELTHYLAARLLGVVAWFDTPTTVAYKISGVARWRQRLIGLAPQLVGATVGVAWLALEGVPWSAAGLVGLAAWATYTVGSWSDVSLAAARGETPWPVRRWRGLNYDAQLASGLAAGGVAAASLAIAGAAVPILQPVSVGVLFGVAVVAARERCREQRPK
jgi:hypothetical protein